MLEIVILAAGKGTRMKSQKPKVLHPIGGKSLLQHVIDCANTLSPDKIHVVVGHGAEQVKADVADDKLNWVLQTQQLGTGHAVQQAMPAIDPKADVLVLYGDVPLIQSDTLKQLMTGLSDEAMALLTVELDDPTGYGRIVRNADAAVEAIVEQKDATQAQLNITEVNTGILAAKAKHLNVWLPTLKSDNAQGEYYLTDIIALAKNTGYAITVAQPNSEIEVLGVNNRLQQAQLERALQARITQQLMVDGVTLIDPARFDCRGELKCGTDVVIDVNVIFEGTVTLGNGVNIGPNCVLTNCELGDNVEVKANTVIEDAVISEACNLGPFARIRPGTVLAKGVKIGNFVETKKAIIGQGSKVNHLSYIGDAEVGEGANIGAGTITCNYDGANKFKTTIGDGVFVGSNSVLVAPVELQAGSFVGAASVITKVVPKDNLAIARARQRNIEGWDKPSKK